MSNCVRIDKVPEFRLDGDGVRVTLFSGTDEMFIHISRAHCRRAADKILRLLNAADREQEARIRDEKFGGDH